ncbi:response regulator [candidate division WOR-3 bacterium]|nr:response regulator [candidate division WOR-3 bacterium]
MNILIVDDEPVLHELLRDIFELHGDCVVSDAYDGVEALRIYRNLILSYKRPDLVIMDHRMPRKDGIETSVEILQIDPSAKILFASADAKAKDRALQIGAIDFIKKPFEISTMYEVIDKLKKSIRGKN